MKLSDYHFDLEEFDVGKYGTVQFLNWLHPNEGRKTFDEAEIDWLRLFIKEGDVVIDVGGYTGDTMIPMLKAVGATGRVIVFEPNLTTFRILQANASLNYQTGTVFCLNAAVGIEDGETEFRYDKTRMNGGALCLGDPIRVRVVRLDIWMEKYHLGRELAYVKFDCEGEDGKLLEEYTPWLKAHGNPVVMLERYPYLTGPEELRLWDAIWKYGVPSLDRDETFTSLISLPGGLCNIIIRPHD